MRLTEHMISLLYWVGIVYLSATAIAALALTAVAMYNLVLG